MSAVPAPPAAAGWDCHVHVFDAHAPARAGHYVPADRPLAQIEALAAAHGIGHLVLVQPSVYGHDHAVLMRALEAGGGRHRGVAVVAAEVTDRELDGLHSGGVRAVRFNLVSPVGHGGDAGSDLDALAPRLRERGWHVQWYVDAAQLPALVALQQRHGLTFVVDHLAGLHARPLDDDAAWGAAAALAREGAWLKVSGWYRAPTIPSSTHVAAVIARAIALFGKRTVWGSDWPHTSFATPADAPSYRELLGVPAGTLGKEALVNIIARHPAALYA